MESNYKNVGIIGMGTYLPERVVTNNELEKMVETSDEWIVQRTGISERRILDKNIPGYTMGVEAARKAIENANLTPEDIDLIITTTFAPDYFSPSTSCVIQGIIGAKNAAAFDINAACTGSIYGLIVGEQFIKTGLYKNVLVVSCEANSKVTDWQDRNTCILFGDGSGAVVLSEVPKGYGILGSQIMADGSARGCITVPAVHISDDDKEKRIHDNKQVIWLDGSEVMKFAVRIMVSSTKVALEKASLTIDDIALIIPHQANIRIIEGAQKRLQVSEDRIYKNMNKYGNMSSASVPVALCEAHAEGRIKDGDNIVLVGFGGGLTWGAIVVKWYEKK